MFILTMTFVLPQKKAEAAVFLGAVPAGITIGAGAYYLGALAFAGVAGYVGYDTVSDSIQNHADGVWADSTQLAKDSMNVMIDAAKGAGNALTATDVNFNTWMDKQIGNLSMSLQNAINGGNSVHIVTSDYTVKTSMPLNNVFRSDILPPDATMFNVMVNGEMTRGIQLFTHATNDAADKFYVRVYHQDVSKETQIPIDLSRISIATLRSMQQEANSIGSIMALMTYAGYQVSILSPEKKIEYDNIVSSTSEAWEDMKDAGLVLPVDSAVPTYQGNAVNWNAQTDTYTGVDGGVINPADLTWSFPQPKIRTGEEADLSAPVAPGVYVDTPLAVPGSTTVPTTTTNVTTGVSTPLTGEGTGTPTEPGTGTGDKKINFKPLVLLGGVIKEKFPFSIPWDVFSLFAQLNVEPVTPVFAIDSGEYIRLGDEDIAVDYDFDIDFSTFDPIAKIIRWALILIFDIAIILALRRLTPD